MSWSDVDLSAYLDGQLSEARRVALEQALAHDAALRARLEELRYTVNLVRAAPLHDVPRNFLLTPSMVSVAPRAHLARRWYPWTRLATALTAIALVITLGLQALPLPLATVPLRDGTSASIFDAPKASAPAPQIAATPEPSGGEITALGVPTEAPTEAAPLRSLQPAPEVAEGVTDTVSVGGELVVAPQPTAPEDAYNPAPVGPQPERWGGALSAALAVLTLLFGGVTLWLGKQQ